VVLSFAYWSLRRLLELVVLRRRSEREKEIEILLLRHQLDMAAVALRDADDASALAPRAGRAALDVSASLSGSARDGGRGT
jgi:hypothetical protein